jgi:hypothetical protein
MEQATCQLHSFEIVASSPNNEGALIVVYQIIKHRRQPVRLAFSN